MFPMEAIQSEALEPKDTFVGSGNRVTWWSLAPVRTPAASACLCVRDRFITSFSTSGWASGSLAPIWRLSATNKGRRNSRNASRRSTNRAEAEGFRSLGETLADHFRDYCEVCTGVQFSTNHTTAGTAHGMCDNYIRHRCRRRKLAIEGGHGQPANS